MAIDRVFLTWDLPILPQAVEYLHNRFAVGDSWDMGSVIVVVRGRRAGRRLLELLARHAYPSSPAHLTGFVPPSIITTGLLPEKLYAPAHQPAGHMHELLAWVRALEHLPVSRRSLVYPRWPEGDPRDGAVAAAVDLRALHHELAGEMLTFADVAQRIPSLSQTFNDQERWSVLAEVQAAAVQILKAHGQPDIQTSRMEAATAQPDAAYSADTPVILLSILELPAVVRTLLNRAERNVTAVIHAPAAEEDLFDQFGCPLKALWQARQVDLKVDAIRLVDTPADQAKEIPYILAALGDSYSPDQITIATGDETVGPAIARALELCGVSAHLPSTADLTDSAPAAALGAALSLCGRPAFAAAANALRDPVLERWVSAQPELETEALDLLTLLDLYAREHAPTHFDAPWPSSARARLTPLRAALNRLTGELTNQAQPVNTLAERLAALLETLYSGIILNRAVPSQDRTARGLIALSALLSQLQRLNPESEMNIAITPTIAMKLLREALREQTAPDLPGDPAVEIVGWLELQMDDAPAQIVTGLNEGCIPASRSGDAWLPDGLRSRIGLTDNAARYARDAYLLTAVAHATPALTLLAARNGPRQEALLPSRLLLACEPHNLPARVERFFGSSVHSARATMLRGADTYRLTVPLPNTASLDRLNVTSFRDYLACPYRFYLKYVLKLRAMDDDCPEMDPPLYGNVAHAALRTLVDLTTDELTKSSVVYDRLMDSLQTEEHRTLEGSRSASVKIQLLQLRRRFSKFARWQAQSAAEGWTIFRCEASGAAALGAGLHTVQGRIDRVDYHPQSNIYRLLDYKTSDKSKSPEQAHRKKTSGELTWVDLQLPLYSLLAQELVPGLEPDRISVGYLNISKLLSQDDTLQVAKWSLEEIASAVDVARSISQRIQQQVFWPPSAALPGYDDGYAAIAFDTCVDRAALIPPAVWSGTA